MGIDIARMAFGAYQSCQDKPVRVEVDPQTGKDNLFGMINPCRFGDQCEWHACYCNNEESEYRKCHYSWFTGGSTSDRYCEYYEPNPYWQEVGDFYESRRATLAYMKGLGLVEEED